jgi:single-stranded-DNA-specific exonuclease
MQTSDLPVLERRLTTIADDALQSMDLRPRIEFDCEISPALLNGENLDFIQSLSPFGSGNPEPVFLTRNARVVQSRKVGARGQHLKMRVSHSGSVWDAIAFRQGDRLEDTRQGVDLLYTVGLDTWSGRPRLQLIVADIRPAR